MNLWKHLIGLILTIAGVVSVNAVPFVPHHHHEGKICVELQDSDEEHGNHTDDSTVHSEEGDFDIPRDDSRLDCVLLCGFPLHLFENITLNDSDIPLPATAPEKVHIFYPEIFLAESGGFRGSPSLS